MAGRLALNMVPFGRGWPDTPGKVTARLLETWDGSFPSARLWDVL